MFARNTFEFSPDLIPDLVDGSPIPQLLSPSSTASSTKSTEERLNRLEALAADQAEEISGLRWSNSITRQEVEGLRVRVAELEAALERISPSTGQSPVVNNTRMDSLVVQQAPATPIQPRQRSRFADFFAQMAAAPRQPDVVGNESVTITSVRPYYAAQLPTPEHSLSEEMEDADPFPCGHRQVSKPNFDFGAHVSATSNSTSCCNEMEDFATLGGTVDYVTGFRSLLATPVQQAAPVSRFRTFFMQVANKEKQASGELRAPQPIRPRAPLLNRMSFGLE